MMSEMGRNERVRQRKRLVWTSALLVTGSCGYGCGSTEHSGRPLIITDELADVDAYPVIRRA